MKPIYSASLIVTKGWGHEEIICNNDEYCGKRMVLRAGKKFSLHAHAHKRETFWVASGRVTLRTLNPENAESESKILLPGAIVEIPRMLPHQIIAHEYSEIIEFSTHHEDSDSYRYEKGDSQT